jgi:hypothetical protein
MSMDAETRAAHAAHARHVATGEGVPFRGVDHAAPGSTDYSAVVEGFKSPDGTLTITRSELIPAPEPVPTGEYCGFCDCGIFSDGSGHHSAQCVDTEAGTKPNPFARKPEPVPAPTVDAGPVPVERILDPDYARIYTQARIVAWQYGWALLAHGSKSRDLDLLLVPWEVRAFNPDFIVLRIANVAGLKIQGPPSEKPHGRKSWSLMLPGFSEVRWVDLSAMTALAKLEPKP